MMTKEALIKERKNNKGERKKIEKKKKKRMVVQVVENPRCFYGGFSGEKGKEGKN